MRKTLKNMALIVILGIILFTLTGCANVNYDIKLNKDGSGDITYVIGYDKSFLASIGVETSSLENDNSFSEMEEQAKQNGYTIEKYEDDNTYGFKATKHANNIQEEFDLNDEAGSNNAETSKIMYEKTLLKTRYYQDSKVDLTDILSDNEEAAMLKAVMSQMKVSYRITLPFRVGSNNATIVSEDGKTIEWTLKVGEVNEIKFEASQDYGMYALLGLAVVLVIVAVVSVFLFKKAKKTEKVKPVEVKKEETKPVVEKTQTEEKNETVEEEKVEVTEAVPEEDTTEEKEEESKVETVEENTTEEMPVVEETEKQIETTEVESKETEETVKEDENKEE
ncbi:MAG: hypothetical protein HFJ57_06355 [Clostridia bacterium]|nr:hypothetical protein [Clostridia bacterium]